MSKTPSRQQYVSDFLPDQRQRSLSTYFNRIDVLTTQTEGEADYSKEITRHHWKSVENVTNCFNRSCRKQFSLLDRYHHCRRCGQIFCSTCIQYKRKLNQLAHLDPQGRLYKVCKACYEEGQNDEGAIRNISEEFVCLRVYCQQNGTSSKCGKAGGGGGWHNRLNIDAECERLIEGFHKSIGRSEVLRTLQELRSMVSLPDWQKSSIWLQGSLMEKCWVCREAFGLLRKQHFCKVCGVALCKSCSTTELLVYVPDDQVPKAGGSSGNSYVESVDLEPRLAIIRIVGCPEVEPEISLHLRVCSKCREYLVKRQVERATCDEEPVEVDMLTELTLLHVKLSSVESSVNSQLRKYQEIVDSLEDNSRSSGNRASGSDSQSNMRTLAKAQGDLTDFLAQHVLAIQQLKRLVPRTHAQSRLLKNYIKAKCDFYLENMSIFRRTKTKLGESSPPEVLEFIQRVMDKNAIVSAHLYLRQLVYEAINLCDKYELHDVAPQLLVSLEQVVEQDVTANLLMEGEDVNVHLELVKEMIRKQMKDHRLIHLSQKAVRERGKMRVQQVLKSRVGEVVAQVNLQLKLKCAHRSFPETKKALEQFTQKTAAM